MLSKMVPALEHQNVMLFGLYYSQNVCYILNTVIFKFTSELARMKEAMLKREHLKMNMSPKVVFKNFKAHHQIRWMRNHSNL